MYIFKSNNEQIKNFNQKKNQVLKIKSNDLDKTGPRLEYYSGERGKTTCTQNFKKDAHKLTRSQH